MKTRVCIIAFFLMAFTLSLSAQTLQKGNLIGTHTLKVTLKEGVTMDQFIKVYSEKMIPAIQKAYPSWGIYLVKSLRGELPEGTIGVIYIISSENERNKYFNTDGTDNALGKSASEMLKPAEEEINKLGKIDETYTDWIKL